MQNKVTLSVAVKPNIVKKVLLTILFIVIGIALPRTFHLFHWAGLIWLPMHIPVLCAGLLLGIIPGAVTGVFSVLGSILYSGKPPLIPTGMAMIFELATYGIVAGLFARHIFKNKQTYIPLLLSLFFAMIFGRIINGIVNYFIAFFLDKEWTWAMYWQRVFKIPFKGMLIQIIFLPLLSTLLYRSKTLDDV